MEILSALEYLFLNLRFFVLLKDDLVKIKTFCIKNYSKINLAPLIFNHQADIYF